MPPKYQQIRTELIRAITSGQYGTGDRLPTCRELARQWNVSYMTINKALNQLAQENYIDLDHGRGIFVRWRQDGDFPRERRVQVFATKSPHPALNFYIDRSRALLSEHGWDVVPRYCDDLPSLLELVRDKSMYSLLFGYQLSKPGDIAALCAAGRERLVMIGERYECFGISSSCVDTSQVIRLAMNHFRKIGRKRIALLCSNLKHPDEAEYAAVWRCIMEQNAPGGDWLPYLWNLELRQMSDPREVLNNMLREKYEAGFFDHIDAVLSTDDQKALITASFCYDHHLRVPDDLALIAVNDSSLAEIVRPRLTTIDTALGAQLENAVRMLEDKVSGHFDGLLLRCAEPRLICRESAPAPQSEIH